MEKPIEQRVRLSEDLVDFLEQVKREQGFSYDADALRWCVRQTRRAWNARKRQERVRSLSQSQRRQRAAP